MQMNHFIVIFPPLIRYSLYPTILKEKNHSMRREKLLSFSTLVLSLSIFLLIVTKIQAINHQNVSSSQCGGININHPFYIKGHPKGRSSRRFELSCLNNKAILKLESGLYYVKQITYNETTITLVDIRLANGSCKLPYKPFSSFDLTDYTYYFYPFNEDGLVARIFNCSRGINDPAYARAPCLSINHQSHVYATFQGKTADEMPESCSPLSRFPIKLPPQVSNETLSSYKTILKFQQLGFDIKWAEECINCSAVGGFCLYNRILYKFYCSIDGEKKNAAGWTAKLSMALSDTWLWITWWPRYLFEYREFFTGSYIFTIFDEHLLYEYREFFTDSYIFTIFYGHLLLSAVLFWRFVLLPIVILLYIIHKYRNTLKKADEVEKFLHKQQAWMPKRYSYAELIAVTNHFEYKLGQGGFGSVYKGILHSGCLIAVKVLENSKFSAEEFINEVSTIGRIHHVNVVQLVGFCSEESKRALVYEYMSNGSLDRYLFSNKGKGLSFNWEKLHEITLGIAHGIKYLHEGCDVCILHFDIKPHNILLDHQFIPKVADFGLAKFYPKENDFVSISATRGTIGYIAPELISRNFGTISCKSDIYSFGMLLLEMAGRRRNSDTRATHSSKAYFPSWVCEQISNGGDLELYNATEVESLIARKLCIIGLWCIQVKPVDRPSMAKVMEMLEGSIDDLQLPPKPFFSSSVEHTTIRKIESDSSTELMLISESVEECLDNNSYV